MKRRIGMAVLVCLLLINVLTGCGNKVQANERKVSETTAAERVSEISAWGEVKSNQEYQINIDFPAMVKGITVKEGDWVKKGDVLAELDMTEFNNQTANLENRISAGEEVLDKTQQNTVGVEAQIAQAQRNIKNAEKDVNNYQILFNSGGISQEELDDYKMVLEQKKTELQVLNIQLEDIKRVNSSTYIQQSNEIIAMKNELQTYKNKKNKEYLKDGQLICYFENAVVKNLNVKQGSLLGEAGTIVMELVDLDAVYVRAEVNEEFVKYLSEDKTVRIVPTKDMEINLSGKVMSISSTAVEKNGNRIVIIQVAADDPNRVLLPGYTADVYFQAE